MTLKEQTKYFEKLPNIILHPTHAHNERVNRRLPYPYFGKREIFCGPNLQNKDTNERKFIRTKGYFFDIGEVISQLDENDRNIDLFLLVLQASKFCFPKNIYKLKCPKLALVGDTHHLNYSLSTIFNYLKHEKVEHILTLSQPAHSHFFYEAGVRHSALLPRIKVTFETVNNKKVGLTYIGHRWSTSHPRRSRMVQFLEENLPINNIPFHFYKRLPTRLWRKVLTHSKMVAISSLNGQFTPQIYNILCAGALCFVDELSSQSLLYQFFEPGKHLVTWRNFEDLLEKIIYYHNHPDEADAIAKTGKLQVENNFAASESMGRIISEFVFEKKIDPRLLNINDARCKQKRLEATEYFDARIRLYEAIQELHRIHESISLISLTEENLNPSADLADLPRLNISHAFISEKSKNEADHYFHNIGVSNQIITTLLNKTQMYRTFDIGILETRANETNWRFMVNSISKFLKKNTLLWVLGNLSTSKIENLYREGFKPFVFKKNQLSLKIRNASRKLCVQFWKMGKYPFPYLTLKPTMETVPNLNVFLRGWQAYLPFLY